MSILSYQEIHDGLIMARVSEHYEESLTLFPESRIVCLCLQGSQNYGLDYEGSDIDTKLIVTLTFEDIAFNKKPVSTTHIRANEEHIDLKDVRNYLDCFKKQNLNFLEILFTPYRIVNPQYKTWWDILVQNREKIAHLNPYRAVKSMKGIAMEKYHAMEHPYPSKLEVLARWGYDGKQVSHLLRVENFLYRYISGESYASCLYPSENIINKLMAYKRQEIPLEIARGEADRAIKNITQMADNFCKSTEDEIDSVTQEILNYIQYNIIKTAIKSELEM